MKEFNTTAVCIPSENYMVDITDRINKIKELVDSGKYFTINRARQYGKTTTLDALCVSLANEYIVISLDFQDIGNAVFNSEGSFAQGLARIICDSADFMGTSIPEEYYNAFLDLNNEDEDKVKLDKLFRIFMNWFRKSVKPIVLVIDEVDSATNNQVFLDFLAQLRSLYLKRKRNRSIRTFQSVILAGVIDVKHLKSKIRDEADTKENSPWNIAADFTIDMSLPEDGIKGMLDEYEADHHTGMDTEEIARLIREYTNGYPFLVSRICQIIDQGMLPETFEGRDEPWIEDGVVEAVKYIITEKNTLFDSLMGKVRSYENLSNKLREILFNGETVAYMQYNKEQEELLMYGFIVNNHNTIAISNRIFEMLLYNYFISESRFADEMRGDALDNKPEFIKGGELNVPLIMERFIKTQEYIRNLNDEEAEKRFIEDEGREKFLTYLSPIINGVGTFSVEERNRDRRRMDVVIHYRGKRYIIELKIWHGDRYNAKGEKQIMDYLDSYGLDTGYLLSFSFNKMKEPGVEEIHIGDKTIYEGIV